jgi:hypothetical protein
MTLLSLLSLFYDVQRAEAQGVGTDPWRVAALGDLDGLYDMPSSVVDVRKGEDHDDDDDGDGGCEDDIVSVRSSPW